jgi:cyclopropane-fatty-acyl-phospholipid synthase
MSQHFFTGGMMPSDDLPLHFQDSLEIIEQWRWDGRHYEKTANAWLANMDAKEALIRPILADCYGCEDAQKWWMRWRMFFMACAELFAADRGQQWWVSHYLFEKPADSP